MNAHRTWNSPAQQAARQRVVRRAAHNPDEDAVDPGDQLTRSQRMAMADSARKARQAKLTYWSSRARSHGPEEIQSTP